MFGANLLNKEQTYEKLKEAKIFYLKGESIEISPILTSGGVIEEFKKKEVIECSTVSVFCINGKDEI